MKLESIVHIIDIYFRPLVIVISTAITILLSWKKIGNSVSANYKIVSDLLSATRIDHIVLVNYKDKPVPVFAIYALLEDKYVLELKVCEPPIVIEPFGAISVETEPFSQVYKKNSEYTPDFLKAKILLKSVGKTIKCKTGNISHIENEKYIRLNKHTQSFNGIVHDDSNPYMILYFFDGNAKTAFVTKSGFVHHEWNFGYNAINLINNQKLDENTINEFLLIFESITNFEVYKLVGNEYIKVLSKSP